MCMTAVLLCAAFIAYEGGALESLPPTEQPREDLAGVRNLPPAGLLAPLVVLGVSGGCRSLVLSMGRTGAYHRHRALHGKFMIWTFRAPVTFLCGWGAQQPLALL